MGIINLFSSIYQFTEIFCSPQTHHFSKRIGKNIPPIPILYQLAETAIHYFITEYLVSKQSVLLTCQQRHGLSGQLTTYHFFISVGKYLNKSIHSLACCFAQGGISNFYHSLLIMSFSNYYDKDMELKDKGITRRLKTMKSVPTISAECLYHPQRSKYSYQSAMHGPVSSSDFLYCLH